MYVGRMEYLIYSGKERFYQPVYEFHGYMNDRENLWVWQFMTNNSRKLLVFQILNRYNRIGTVFDKTVNQPER